MRTYKSFEEYIIYHLQIAEFMSLIGFYNNMMPVGGCITTDMQLIDYGYNNYNNHIEMLLKPGDDLFVTLEPYPKCLFYICLKKIKRELLL